MLSKEFRITRKRFEIVWKKGRREKQRGVSLVHLANSVGHPRVSLVVKKGMIALATKRNYLKRKLFNLLEKEIKISSKNLDLVVVVHQKPKSKDEIEYFKRTVLEKLR